MWFLTAFYLYKAWIMKSIKISKNSSVYDLLVRGHLLKPIYKPSEGPEPFATHTGRYKITVDGKKWLISFEKGFLTWIISIAALAISLLAYLKK
jgi:hypothetical protein